MHELVLLVYFLSICFTGKSGETLLVNINSEGFVASYAYVDSEVKLVSIYE